MPFKTLQTFLCFALYIYFEPEEFNSVVGSNILNATEHRENSWEALSRSSGSEECTTRNTSSATKVSFNDSGAKVSKQTQSGQSVRKKELLANVTHRNELCESSSSGLDLRQLGNVVSDTSEEWTDATVESTAPEQHPYAVILFIFDHSTHASSCSGSLVSLEWVLTAASHCFVVSGVKPTHVQVYAGGSSEREWLEESYPPGHQLRNSSDFFVHPHYSRDGFSVSYYDVALVKVSEFSRSSTVSAVGLHTRPWHYKGYARCTVTGYGRQQSGDDVLRRTYYLRVKSPCPCLDTKNTKSHNWICSSGFGMCGSVWGAALVCESKISALAAVVVSYKSMGSCAIDDDHEECLCGKENSLSIFQNTFPCIKWMNNYLNRFRVVRSTNTANMLHFVFLFGFIHSFVYIL